MSKYCFLLWLGIANAALAQPPILPTPLTGAEIAALNDVLENRPRLVFNKDSKKLLLCQHDGTAISCSEIAGAATTTLDSNSVLLGAGVRQGGTNYNRTSDTVTFADGRTWADVKNEFTWIHLSLRGNNYDGAGRGQLYHVEDLDQGREYPVMNHFSSGSNSYRTSVIIPADSSTTITHSNDGTTATYDGFRITGIKDSNPPTVGTYTLSYATTQSGVIDFNWADPFQVAETGLYSVTTNAVAADRQGTRVSYNFQIRTAASGGGTEVAGWYMSVDSGAGASNQNFTLPEIKSTVNLTAGTDYYIFGDRNTGGLNNGNRWTLELVKQ